MKWAQFSQFNNLFIDIYVRTIKLRRSSQEYEKNMKKTVLTIAITTALSFNAPVFAEESEGAKWSGTGQLGFSMTSGNSDTENLTAGLAIKRESEKWVSDLSLDILRASTNDVDTAERYTLNTKTGYKTRC